MYNGLIQKLEYLFPRALSTADTIDVQMYGRRRNFLPERVQRPNGQILNEHRQSRIQVANCKGHILGSKAIRRHLGVPLSSTMPSNEQKKASKSFNISRGLAAAVHDAVNNQHGYKANRYGINNGKRKTPSGTKHSSGYYSDKFKYSSRSLKIDNKPCFENVAKGNKMMFLSDTNLLYAKSSSSEKVMNCLKIENPLGYKVLQNTNKFPRTNLI